MRRLLSVCLLMLCLSLPVFAGHILIGGRSEWCECGGPVPECACDGGELPARNAQQQPAGLGSETLLVLAMLLLTLRYKP